MYLDHAYSSFSLSLLSAFIEPIYPHHVPSMEATMLIWKKHYAQFYLSLGNSFSYLVGRLLKKSEPCSLHPARMSAALPKLMKDCHHVHKCLSQPKVRRCLSAVAQPNANHRLTESKEGEQITDAIINSFSIVLARSLYNFFKCYLV